MVDPKEIIVGSHYVWSRHGRQSVVQVLDGPHRLPPEDDLDTVPPTVNGKGAEWGFRVRLLDDELRYMIARADELEPPWREADDGQSGTRHTDAQALLAIEAQRRNKQFTG